MSDISKIPESRIEGLETTLANKQDKLTAGPGIIIDSNNVISSTGGSGTINIDNYAVTGYPTIENNELTIHPHNFDGSYYEYQEYFSSNVQFAPGNSTWKIQTKFKINPNNNYWESESPNYLIGLGPANGNTQKTLSISKTSNDVDPVYLYFAASSDGENWDISDGSTQSVNSLQIDTDYYLRVYFTGTEYNVDISEDKITWTNFFNIESSDIIFQEALFNLLFGSNAYVSDSTGNSDCTFYLEETFAEVNGTIVWRAINTYTLPLYLWYKNNTGSTITIINTGDHNVVLYRNGVLMEPDGDYSISGTTVTFVTQLNIHDKITLGVLS